MMPTKKTGVAGILATVFTALIVMVWPAGVEDPAIISIVNGVSVFLGVYIIGFLKGFE